MAEDDAVLERRLAEERRGHGKQGVEPPSRLVNRLGDEVRGEGLFEDFLVLEGIVPLCKGHRTAVIPAVQHLGRAVHLAAALALEGHFVDVRTVQLDAVVEPAEPAKLLA